MLPGKTYTPEDFLRIAWTRKWFLVIPTVLIAAAVFAWSYQLPNVYRATTIIQVIPQRVPTDFVRPTVTTGVAQRLRTITQEILSRTRLERIIDEFNLYQEERETMIMEDIVDRMRREHIKVDMATNRRGRDGSSSFSVSYLSHQPRVAMLVTERLAQLFVQENLEERELQAESTDQFLQAQLEDARRRLQEYELKLQAFREKNRGQMPNQMQSNLQMMQNAQQRLIANAEAMVRERERLGNLEAAIADAAVATVAPAPTPEDKENNGGVAVPAGATAAQRLEAAKAQLRTLEVRLKPEHPDLRRAQRAVADLEVKAEAEALAAAVSTEEGGAPKPVAATKLAEWRKQADELRASLDKRQKDEVRLQASLASYTTKVEIGPSVDSQLTDMMRDYSTVEGTYKGLLAKSEASKIAINLERRQIGEQFKVMDGARLPERPVSPNRLRHYLLGLLGGLGVGLALVAFLTYRDTTLKTDQDVIESLSLPVLAVIPTMITTGERRRMRRRRIVLAMSASVASVLLVAAVVAWRLQLLENWVR